MMRASLVLAPRVLLVTLASCAGLAESSYTAEQARCVDQARTLAESKACRARVDQRWHVERDGAAP